MNNTKWRECISLLASHCIYLQLRLVGEADFPLDYEVSNEVISQIQAKDCVFVRRVIAYKSITALRIIKTDLPPSARALQTDMMSKLKQALSQLGQLPLTEDSEFITINGYYSQSN